MVSAASPDRLNRLIAEMVEDSSMNEGVVAMRERGQFEELTEKLVGIGLVDRARKLLDNKLDEFWTHDKDNGAGISSRGHDEVIIGGGYHAAVYSSVRYMMGKPKPLVIDNGARVGGAFACSEGPSFYLNSRNRPGPLNVPGQRGALNVIPGSPIQPSMLSNSEFQRNNDMAFVIRLALAMKAKVVANTKVVSVDRSSTRGERKWRVVLEDGRSVIARRVIFAGGLGVAKKSQWTKGDHGMTFLQFMGHMDTQFPFRGLDRVAVLGEGDSGKCALEALFGLGPAEHWSIPDLDMPRIVDWYGAVPTTCDDFIRVSRNRYKRLGALLPKSTSRGIQSPVRPIQKKPVVDAGFECAFVDGKPYDLVINCIGFRREFPPVADNTNPFTDYKFSGPAERIVLGLRSGALPEIYSIGPVKDIPYSADEKSQGYDSTTENAVAMWRLGSRTATLAQQLS